MKAVFFDVDFTLIYPGPTFTAEGYTHFALRHGFYVDAARFDLAVASAAMELDGIEDDIYRAEPFLRYAEHVLRGMGGEGSDLRKCAEEIYEEWADCRHFDLYDDVIETFRQLQFMGLSIGLISNTHRCLDAFQSHFALESFVTYAISSYEHGYLKPHPTIFHEALRSVGIDPPDGLMVGDSMAHDVVGAQRVGMCAVLLVRSGSHTTAVDNVQIIRTLTELPSLIQRFESSV